MLRHASERDEAITWHSRQRPRVVRFGLDAAAAGSRASRSRD